MTTNYAGLIPRSAAFIAAVALCVVAMTTHRAWSQTRTPTEYEVKAAFLFNFAKFAELPENAFSGPDKPLVFCVLGADPFGKDLDVVLTRTVNGRATDVRRLKAVPEQDACHVLFISASESERLSPILRALDGSGALLVSDMHSFTERGGMIGFVMQNGRVGFKINVDAVTRSGISLHSRLLNMAVIVHDAPRRAGK